MSLMGQFKIEYQNDFNYVVTGVSTLNNPKNNTLLFLKRVKDDTILTLSKLIGCIIIVPQEELGLFLPLVNTNLIIGADNPRLEYARILQFILDCCQERPAEVCLASSIGKNFIMGTGTIIEKNVSIGDHVQIGQGCTIRTGVVINNNVIIGDGTVIRENSVIGGPGFGFERDENGIPIRLPHIGGVVIGNQVEIGALVTIASGTIEPTIIEDYTKIDDHVHISHNCHIGKGCLIIACAEISGSVKIGNYTWLGPNCSIINGISIGDNCLIGIGAVVNKSVKDDMIVSGNPGQSLENIKKERDLFKKLSRADQAGYLEFDK